MQTQANASIGTNSVNFDDLLTAGATWLLIGSAGWLALILGAAALERATAGRLRATSWVGCPPALRRVLLTGLGVALATSPAQAAMSTPGSSGGTTAGAGTSATQGLPSPARPVGPSPADRQRLVVRQGDVLWRLAEGRLPRTAASAEVADLVRRLHDRNRQVIGPDPDLIRPGQRLIVPTLPLTSPAITTRRTHDRSGP